MEVSPLTTATCLFFILFHLVLSETTFNFFTKAIFVSTEKPAGHHAIALRSSYFHGAYY